MQGAQSTFESRTGFNRPPMPCAPLGTALLGSSCGSKRLCYRGGRLLRPRKEPALILTGEGASSRHNPQGLVQFVLASALQRLGEISFVHSIADQPHKLNKRRCGWGFHVSSPSVAPMPGKAQ